MGKLVEQIQSLGYHFTEGRPLRSVPLGDGFQEIRELKVGAGDGQTMTLKHDESPTLFPASIAVGEEIAGNALAEGVKTTCAAVYRDYYNLDDNGYSLLVHNYSDRTGRYLDAEKRRIGLTGYKEDVPEAFFALDRYLIGQGIGEVVVGRYADGRFVAQTAAAQFDDGLVLRMHYTRFPSAQDVEDTITIRKMERDFKLGRHREMFHCGDCGEIKHWLDVEGTIQQKLEMRLAHKCGCA